ncbi:tyrosine-type recombinase/integrase [Kineococcus rubinsiae]|uniref:tyrosine-type recombinase/integrase n=1 Tax=Kineococcus rubinsiae TaxID=2609562 RepID=UPI00358DA908
MQGWQGCACAASSPGCPRALRLPRRSHEWPLFLASDTTSRYPYKSAYEQLGRLCRAAGLPAGVTPHSLRHSYATESLRLGAPLQDVQDAMGHADPRTTRRYDRSRHNLDRSPNYLLATALTSTDG